MNHAWIGLGGNLGEVPVTFQTALAELEKHNIHTLACSPLYRTAPVGPQDQSDFINAAAHIETPLSAHALLAQLLATEDAFGRQRHRHWGERTLDLDVLLFNDDVIQTDDLTVPHPRLHERAFVLVPLNEIAGDIIVPSINQSVAALSQQCNSEGVWYYGSLPDNGNNR